jgi:hypothetical protein
VATDPNTINEFEELDHRETDGIEVCLLWNRTDYNLSVLVIDSKTDELVEFAVSSDEAMDAFRHPFAYAAARARNLASGRAGPTGRRVSERMSEAKGGVHR